MRKGGLARIAPRPLVQSAGGAAAPAWKTEANLRSTRTSASPTPPKAAIVRVLVGGGARLVKGLSKLLNGDCGPVPLYPSCSDHTSLSR